MNQKASRRNFLTLVCLELGFRVTQCAGTNICSFSPFFHHEFFNAASSIQAPMPDRPAGSLHHGLACRLLNPAGPTAAGPCAFPPCQARTA
jgi:hypothetical protein